VDAFSAMRACLEASEQPRKPRR